MRNQIAIATLALVCAVPAAAQGGGAFTLSSKEVAGGKQIPLAQVFGGMGCTGSNVSPSLAWHGAPAGTKSFALTMYDPDAPTGSGWWHWVVYDIPGSATGLVAGAGDPGKKLLPAGTVQGNTDFGAPGYGGPCPPAGAKPHHYIFTLYALKVAKLDVPAGASAAYVGFNIHANAIGQVTFTSLYGR